ncbi:MAG TPA: DEAD/DEAH box helicase [Acidimicrobiales bacterium]|nr:DEAD/DEAH box helicase [Acidimicrobiales bacterium]
MPTTFADLGVPDHLLEALAAGGAHEPWPIQRATLPDAMAGRDISGRAPTGSGKTIAFAIPAVMAARPPSSASRRAERRGVGSGRPEALILVPTRELAVQVERSIAPLAKAAGLRTRAVYGGANYAPQRGALRRGVQIVVGCPGRIEDMVERRDLHLEDVRLAVVDEADRMADMGFLPAVRRILDATRPDRQTLLFSATLDGDVDVLVRRYQRSPVRHEVVADPADGAAVTHLWWQAGRDQRLALTAELVRTHHPAIVFCRTRLGAERLTARLAELGVPAAAIHGDRSQVQRERALEAFTAGAVAALVATDVAARGIHVDDVGCVVHYDLPADPKDYLHRSGRTGRAGAEGVVVSLVAHEQAKAAKALQRAAGLPQGLTQPDMGALPRPTRAPVRFTAGRRPEGDTARGGWAPRASAGRGGAPAGRSRAGGPPAWRAPRAADGRRSGGAGGRRSGSPSGGPRTAPGGSRSRRRSG